MKRILLLIALLATYQVLVATKPTFKNFRTLPFEKVAVTGGFDINVSQSSSNSLQIIGTPTIISRVKVAVREGLLTIEMTKDRDRRLRLKSTEIPTINLSVANLNNLQIDGYANLKTKNRLKTKSLYLFLSGSSKIDATISCQSIDLTANGASYIKLKGEAESVKLTMNGAGMYDGAALNTSYTNIVINGTGKALVNSKRLLKGNINGFGAVYYHGDPAISIKKDFGIVKRIP